MSKQFFPGVDKPIAFEGRGSLMMSGKSGLGDCEKWILEHGAPLVQSARQEMLENILNPYIQ